jgi:hypothetical protein
MTGFDVCMAEQYSIGYIHDDFFAYSSKDGKSCQFHIFTIVNSTAINMGL